MEDANKKKLNSALSEYVSSNIAEEILAEKQEVESLKAEVAEIKDMLKQLLER